MNIQVIKPKEDKWKFPCKGIRKKDGKIIGFKRYGEGTVLEANLSLGMMSQLRYRIILNKAL